MYEPMKRNRFITKSYLVLFVHTCVVEFACLICISSRPSAAYNTNAADTMTSTSIHSPATQLSNKALRPTHLRKKHQSGASSATRRRSLRRRTQFENDFNVYGTDDDEEEEAEEEQPSDSV